MCLSIKVNRPEVVLEEGAHCGYEWVIVHNDMAYRCGYVRVPKGHPWHGKDYNAIEAEVHGGLTFAEPDKPCAKGGQDDAWWIGFDCAHLGDAPDPALPKYRAYGRERGAVRSQVYVREECKSLCEQAQKAATLFLSTLARPIDPETCN